MSTAGVERALQRDRVLVVTALAIVMALAWVYLLRLAGRMDMSGGGMTMSEMTTPSVAPWGAGEFLLIWVMWTVMMAGMMLPSVTPMVLIYSRVARQALDGGMPFASATWFLGGYLVAWVTFSAAATAAQWGLEQAALMSPMTMATGQRVGGAILILAGIYQWTRLKENCLAQCQAPLVFIQRHGGFRRGALGALSLGWRHGLYCVGCCWALMGLLFVAGVMNVIWIALIAVFVLLEKVLPWPRGTSRVTGAALVVVGGLALA